MGIMAARQRQIVQVGAKILVTPRAMMLRIGDLPFDWSPRYQIANIMQPTLVNVLSPGGLPALRTRSLTLVAVFFDDLGTRQIFEPHKDGLGFVLARTVFRIGLGYGGSGFHPASLL
jgi:hypothetical protein